MQWGATRHDPTSTSRWRARSVRSVSQTVPVRTPDTFGSHGRTPIRKPRGALRFCHNPSADFHDVVIE